MCKTVTTGRLRSIQDGLPCPNFNSMKTVPRPERPRAGEPGPSGQERESPARAAKSGRARPERPRSSGSPILSLPNWLSNQLEITFGACAPLGAPFELFSQVTSWQFQRRRPLSQRAEVVRHPLGGFAPQVDPTARVVAWQSVRTWCARTVATTPVAKQSKSTERGVPYVAHCR